MKHILKEVGKFDFWVCRVKKSGLHERIAKFENKEKALEKLKSLEMKELEKGYK